MERKNKMRVCLLLMSADPRRGSEPGRAVVMARNIISDDRVSDPIIIYPVWEGNVAHVDAFLRGGNSTVTLIPVEYQFNSKIFHLFPLKYCNYFLYNRKVSYLAKSFSKRVDLFHQVNYAGFRFAMPILSSSSVTVWGPISGTENFPLRKAWPYLDGSGRLYYMFYLIINWMQFHLFGQGIRAFKKVNLILAATSIDLHNLKTRTRDVRYLPETGYDAQAIQVSRPKVPGKPVQLMWSGALISRKGFPLLLAALRSVDLQLTGPIEVHVYGRGPKEKVWRKQAARVAAELGGQVRFCWQGEVAREQFLLAMGVSDLLVATTFREANSNVIAEAIAEGVPVVGLEVSGLRDTLVSAPNKLVPLNSQDLPKAFGSAIEELITSRGLTTSQTDVIPVLRDNVSQGRLIVDFYEDVLHDARARSLPA